MNPRKVKALWSSALAPVLASLIGNMCPKVAHAENDNEATETAAARAIAIEGVKLAQGGQCQEAVEKLDRAEQLKHSAVVLRYLGECQIELGQLVEGSESLRRLLREPLPEGASPAITQAYESAAASLRDVKGRIATIKIQVSAPEGADVSVKVDGQKVATSAIGVSLPNNPGAHTVEASAPGFITASSPVHLAPGASSTVVLRLNRDPHAPAPQPHVARERTAQSGSPSKLNRRNDETPIVQQEGSNVGPVLGYLSYGVAAAGLGVGIFYGQSAMRDERALRDACPGRVCPPEESKALASARNKGVISTIGFAVAGGGLALGSILLFTSSGPSPSRSGAIARGTSSDAHSPQLALQTQLHLGPGSVAISTRF